MNTLEGKWEDLSTIADNSLLERDKPPSFIALHQDTKNDKHLFIKLTILCGGYIIRINELLNLDLQWWVDLHWKFTKFRIIVNVWDPSNGIYMRFPRTSEDTLIALVVAHECPQNNSWTLAFPIWRRWSMFSVEVAGGPSFICSSPLYRSGTTTFFRWGYLLVSGQVKMLA